jgi:lipopolysaccharide export system protein LptA
MAILRRNLTALAFALALTGVGPFAWAQAPDLALQKTLPIALDADSSEFDRKNDRLLFKGLRITQGSLHIEADEAEANQLDFEKSRWIFSGNVVIENVGTKAYCDYAEIFFLEHQIQNAVMRGQPARFTQIRLGDDLETQGETQGRANAMEYDLQSGLISMSKDAWLSDGSNEVSGDRITYDLVREYIIADADESGQVRMKINPPEKKSPGTGAKETQ